MLDKDKSRAIIRSHFSRTTPEEFRKTLGEGWSDHSGESLPESEQKQVGRSAMTQIGLFEPVEVQVPLEAYLASALTGLEQDQRNLIFHISDMVSYVCERIGIEVYEPRKKTDPVNNPEISDSEVFWLDRSKVLSSDLLVLLCHYPSFGAGEELEFANGALIPTLLISHSENPVSRMVTGIPGLKVRIEYSEPENLRAELEIRLREIRPLLEERKMAFSTYDVNIVGERIRLRREQLCLSRRQVASSLPRLPEELLKRLEESTDKVGNPSLLQLRELAAVLNTTVADLVEPDMGSQVIARLDEWTSGRVAARGGESALSRRDRNRMIRRLLLRILDSLEEDDIIDFDRRS